MAPPAIAVLLAFSAAAMAVAAGWLLAWVVAPGLLRRVDVHPDTRARLLAGLRLLPLASAGMLVPIQILSFVRFETGGPETAGPLLIALAACGGLLFIDAALAGLASWRRTRAIVSSWRASAMPLGVPRWKHDAWSIQRRFPVVAVAGVVRPQLFVAEQVAASCSVDELAAIAVHESAHVRSRDNLVRLLFALTPARRLMPRFAGELEQAWATASEEAADLEAMTAASRLDLAAALTKVARMADGVRSEVAPVSALIGRDGLDARVRRLLDPAPIPPTCGPLVAWLPVAACILLLAVVLSTPALSTVHELFESLVRR
jgi:hypothetical protein